MSLHKEILDMFSIETLELYGNPIISTNHQLAQIKNDQEQLKKALQTYFGTSGASGLASLGGMGGIGGTSNNSSMSSNASGFSSAVGSGGAFAESKFGAAGYASKPGIIGSKPMMSG